MQTADTDFKKRQQIPEMDLDGNIWMADQKGAKLREPKQYPSEQAVDEWFQHFLPNNDPNFNQSQPASNVASPRSQVP